MVVNARSAQARRLPTARYGTPCVETTQTIPPADARQPAKVLLEALLSGKEVPTAEEGRMAVAILVAAYESHERGHVAIRNADGMLPHDRVFPWA